MTRTSEVELRPVFDQDVNDVAEFFHAHDAEIDARLSPDLWAQAIAAGWRSDAPNRGFMLTRDGRVVGAYLAFYSERLIDERIERFCNLATWCVDADYRQHSLRLLKAILDQPGYHFTDLSPAEQVVRINERLGFTALDTSRISVRTFPWPILSRRVKVVSAHDEIVDLLDGADLEIYHEHRLPRGLLQVVVADGDRLCHLIFRVPRGGRIRKVPYVRLLYASNPGLLRRNLRSVASHLLIRHAALAIRSELRLLGGSPTGSARVQQVAQQRMFKSSSLRPDQVDYLYSELTHVNSIINGPE